MIQVPQLTASNGSLGNSTIAFVLGLGEIALLESPTQLVLPDPRPASSVRYASKRKLTLGISKSQEFDIARTRFSKHNRLSKSNNHSPTNERRKVGRPVSPGKASVARSPGNRQCDSLCSPSDSLPPLCY
ncbi:hypothetical protein ACFX11_019691 [Malus domestica]|uniref:Uncharacterized protein n=1 Tax=Malus domestica TaxID=3750 RepID=A0A498I1U4_MALDO|nr:hypothetical protein DVH24_042732 [Malus domestica]